MNHLEELRKLMIAEAEASKERVFSGLSVEEFCRCHPELTLAQVETLERLRVCGKLI